MLDDADDPFAFLRRADDRPPALRPARRPRRASTRLWCFRATCVAFHLALAGLTLHCTGIMPVPAIGSLIAAIHRATAPPGPSPPPGASPARAGSIGPREDRAVR